LSIGLMVNRVVMSLEVVLLLALGLPWPLVDPPDSDLSEAGLRSSGYGGR